MPEVYVCIPFLSLKPVVLLRLVSSSGTARIARGRFYLSPDKLLQHPAVWHQGNCGAPRGGGPTDVEKAAAVDLKLSVDWSWTASLSKCLKF